MARLKLAVALVAALTLGTAAAVHAGAKWNIPLQFFTTSNGYAAAGALGSIRNDGSSDFLGCVVDVTPNWPTDPVFGAPPVVFCQAYSASGSLACTSDDAGIVRVAQTITTDSYVKFSAYQNPLNLTDPRNGTCTYLKVQNYSGYAPKGP